MSTESTSSLELTPTRLKVLTFNVWGIPIPLPWPFGSKDRYIRIPAIANALAESDYDIVALQEVWSLNDYEIIKNGVSHVLPNSFYFHSGFSGSGVCIFTKHKIYDTMMHRYSLNGYPHHLHTGDWYGGKVVGLTRIKLPNNLRIDVYNTHLHAEYDRDNDLYLPHRVLQAYELSEFMNGTTKGDMVLLMGDLNIEPADFGLSLIKSMSGLTDAADPSCGMTHEVPTNYYTNPLALQRQPQGKKIDYIMYRANRRVRISSRDCQTCMGRIPSLSINYSDHEAVRASLEINPNGNQPPIIAADIQLIDNAIKSIDDGIAASRMNRWWFGGLLAVLFFLFAYTINIEVGSENRVFPFLALGSRSLLVLSMGYIFIYGVVGLKMEQKALQAAKSGMLVYKNNLGNQGANL